MSFSAVTSVVKIIIQREHVSIISVLSGKTKGGDIISSGCGISILNRLMQWNHSNQIRNSNLLMIKKFLKILIKCRLRHREVFDLFSLDSMRSCIRESRTSKMLFISDFIQHILHNLCFGLRTDCRVFNSVVRKADC